jgi:phage terminase large subunit
VPVIRLPHNWEPRDYQQNLWNYLNGGGKRAVAIWHRRAGKDDLALHWTACAAMRRPGVYWHMLPEASMARKAIWNAVNPHTGKRRIHEAFPMEIIARTLENEMFLEFINGSTWQLVGSDNYNSLVGSPPVGIVFSEWALADPNAWSYLRPILRENDGWALFITTPRGRNHAATFYESAKDDPDWFAERLPATITSVFSKADLDIEKKEFMREYGPDQGLAIYDQEYLCSFQSALLGAYYGSEMETADREGRITSVPHDPRLPTHTAWDLGISDATAIWCIQLVGKEIHCIDYLENSGVGMDWYARELQRRPWLWGQHILPHDAQVRELGTGRSRVETLRSLGINARVVPAQSVQDGINAVRTLLPLMWFDKAKCKDGIAALQQYRRTWDDKRKIYNDRPYHDWCSHGSDALRIYAMANVRNAMKREIHYSNMGII